MREAIVILILNLMMMISSGFVNAKDQKEELKNSGYTFGDTLCTPNPSGEAVALYRYLQDMYGELILSGQMWVPWGIDEMDYIESVTGKFPAIAGLDFINSYANADETQRALDYWVSGGIPTIMWHWGAPGIGEGYENSKETIHIDSCFIEGTDEYEDFWFELDRKADHLEILRDANIPVLWRPFHELNGGWFWWSKEGPEQFKRLWTTMFDYFVYDRGLNNLIWVLCYTGSPDGDWFPGNEYVDIAGADTYDGSSESHLGMFNDVASAIDGNNYPICFHECGVPPDPDQCLSSGAMWSWWMEWHTDYLTNMSMDYLTLLYEHELVITRDKIPDIMSVYSWDDTCSASEIVPSVQVDGVSWQQTNTVTVAEGSVVTFSPQTSDAGSWNWNGCGVSDTLREQTVTASAPCTATVTFLNKCGAISTQTFNIRIEESTYIHNLPIPDNSLLRFYPNPCQDYIHIDLLQVPEDIHSTIGIYSVEGTLMYEEVAESIAISIQTSKLEQGLYFIRVENSEGVIVRKLLKN